MPDNLSDDEQYPGRKQRGDKDVAFRSVKMTFPKEIEPGKAIKVTAGIGGAGIWVADQLIYDPGIVTVDGDTATNILFVLSHIKSTKPVSPYVFFAIINPSWSFALECCV